MVNFNNMLLTLILLVPLHHIHALTSSDTDVCCYPDRLEARNWIFQEYTYRYFAIDYKTKLLFHTLEPNSQEFNITDFGMGEKYIFSADGCRTESYPHQHIFPQCYRVLAGRHRLGEQGSGLDVDYYLVLDDNVLAQDLVVRRGNFCYPLLRQTTSGTDVETAIFGQEKKDVKPRDLLQLITKCQRHVLMS